MQRSTSLADLGAEFRHAMRRLAATPTILSGAETAGRSGWRGMTATGVTALSADPASLLISVNQARRFHVMARPGARLCVNLLAERHADSSPEPTF